MAVLENGARAELDEKLSWSEHAEVAIATVSAYPEEDSRDETRAARAAAPNLGRVGSTAFLAVCLIVELAWLVAIVYLLLGFTRGLFA